MRDPYDIRPGPGYFDSDSVAGRRALGIKDHHDKQAEKYNKWLKDLEEMASPVPGGGVPQPIEYSGPSGGSGDGVPWLGVFVMLFIPPLMPIALFVIVVYAFVRWREKKAADSFKREIQELVRKGCENGPATEPVFNFLEHWEEQRAAREAAEAADAKKDRNVVTEKKPQAKNLEATSPPVVALRSTGNRPAIYLAPGPVARAWIPLPKNVPEHSLMRQTTLYRAQHKTELAVPAVLTLEAKALGLAAWIQALCEKALRFFARLNGYPTK